MNTKELILAKINESNKTKTKELTKITGFTRAYINTFLQELEEEGKIIKLGHTKGAFYIPANNKKIQIIKSNILEFNQTLINVNLHEENILQTIKQQTGIFFDLPDNVINILEYSFLEMVNNAIEHSKSKKIKIKMAKTKDKIITFTVEDQGIGIFENIKNIFKLPDILSAIQELLKGKQTTEPTQHTGQGIFFTSKMADNFTIKSSNKILMINNLIDDIFIEDRKTLPGTTIIFTLNTNTKRTSQEIFNKFTDKEYEFSKTQVKIKLFKIAKNLLSRSEARRIIFGLEKFQEIILDFQDVESIGQAFADEIFRVWQSNHQETKITYININENIEFMIKRAL